ncbi:glutamate--cysteine ligase [Vibrio sp. S11_S32]|uniref:glutamate--cysteine ligase n=1 Tax=Vibrio sp. S11_S32 TaxID=2720225 RepID=UPI00167FF734|nr:glutamate--cysteine ligase [Vibrio sp. S11_S32]
MTILLGSQITQVSAILTDFSARLQQVANNPKTFKQFGRGIEREALRYDSNDQLALTPHPAGLGSALTNKWITTDFSESLLEFITPVSHNVDTLLNQLTDIHHFSMTKMRTEKLWPMSMPCFVSSDDSIPLAEYGSSNSGRMKNLYRKGLNQRYGSLMQIISGVHFNFSFPESFWDSLYGQQNQDQRVDSKSEGYFHLIRNYYRYGWIIPYLFGASPALCSSFVKGRDTGIDFDTIGKTLYLPHATALRLSDLGYTNSAQGDLNITFNSLEDYLLGLHDAMHKPSDKFSKLGVKVDGEHRQLNSNVLQIENELYAPIRPKRVAEDGEKPSCALKRAGVEYIEVRSLDVNPFSPIGVSKQQVLFLDLFVAWCALKESAPMKKEDIACWRSNWTTIILEGRKPDLAFKLCSGQESKPMQVWGHEIFSQLRDIAIEMDKAHGNTQYQDVCDELSEWIDDPEKTISGQLLAEIKSAGGIGKFGTRLGEQYRLDLLNHEYKVYKQSMMENEAQRSKLAQAEIEAADTLSFDDFLAEYFSYLR